MKFTGNKDSQRCLCGYVVSGQLGLKSAVIKRRLETLRGNLLGIFPQDQHIGLVVQRKQRLHLMLTAALGNV